MTLFLIPIGARTYQMYVEIADDASVSAAPSTSTGWFGRVRDRFRATLAEAEAERLRRERGESTGGSGLWPRILGRVAEAIAEQRLLWHLRDQRVVTLCHPSDLDERSAVEYVRTEFSRDAAKHLRWLIVDGLIASVTGPAFFFVPGPNVISWYFTFRAIGHFLSWRGARRGLTGVEWKTSASGPLSSLRLALALPATDRRARLEEIAAALELKHLVSFVERIARKTA